ncbi:hypothetical protein N9992_00525 [bacterium]|nr:hypothetical protein [bacterium]
MAYTTIDDPSEFFQALTYTGNGSHPRNLTNTGNSDLKPDFIWTRNRTDNSSNHVTANSSLGFNAPKGQGYAWENGPFGGQMSTDSSGTASTPAATYGYVSAALTDGFTAAAGGTNGDVANANNKEFVAFQWKCNGGTKANNTDGNITTSVQVNSTCGFSIGMYEGSGANNATIGHGLGAIPDFFMIKGTGHGASVGAQYWVCGAPNHPNFANNSSKHVFLDTTHSIMNNTTIWRNEAFTTSIVPMGTHASINTNGGDYIFYAFKNIQGYSKIGHYIGNGNSNGPFVHTGFKPAFVLIKNLDATQVWIMYNIGTKPFNQDAAANSLYASETTAEYQGASYHNLDILSNGFKVRLTDASQNGNGVDYLYMAFAHNPFVTSTGLPTTAQ